jgi:alpha/beta hydrolase family protein
MAMMVSWVGSQDPYLRWLADRDRMGRRYHRERARGRSEAKDRQGGKIWSAAAARRPACPAGEIFSPRRSIAARYPGKAAYLDEVSHAAQRLIDAGYLLPEDVERILTHSARRWDLLTSAPESAAAQ